MRRTDRNCCCSGRRPESKWRRGPQAGDLLVSGWHPGGVSGWGIQAASGWGIQPASLQQREHRLHQLLGPSWVGWMPVRQADRQAGRQAGRQGPPVVRVVRRVGRQNPTLSSHLEQRWQVLQLPEPQRRGHWLTAHQGCSSTAAQPSHSSCPHADKLPAAGQREHSRGVHPARKRRPAADSGLPCLPRCTCMWLSAPGPAAAAQPAAVGSSCRTAGSWAPGCRPSPGPEGSHDLASQAMWASPAGLPPLALACRSRRATGVWARPSSPQTPPPQPLLVWGCGWAGGPGPRTAAAGGLRHPVGGGQRAGGGRRGWWSRRVAYRLP